MPGGGGVKTACVTGGNGYIASALVKMLLEKGFAVKATVRNPDDTRKNAHLRELQALGHLEILRADLDEEGSFDGAVAGCDYAFLVAAPVNLASENPEREQIEPSVRGTLNVMRSCARAGTVKRVVLTSSASSICIRRPLEGDGHVLELDEESWSDLEWVTAEKPPSWGYVVSKVLSEKEALRFAEEHGMSLAIACPVLTVGASPVPEVYTSVPASLSMLSAALGMLKGIEKTFGGLPIIDVDDLCRAEVFLAETEAASGRYICSSFTTTIVEIARFLSEKYRQYSVNIAKQSGDDGELLEKPRVRLSSAKLVKEGFEFRYKTLDEVYQDVVEYGRTLGILPY